MFYWLMHRLLAGPVLKSTFQPWVRGAEHVPSKGAVLLASNHLSVIDSVFLPLVMERPVSFLAKQEYFSGKGVKGAITREFMKATGMLPIDRSGGAGSEASLRAGLEVLNRERVLGIYPEGTRSPDARLYRGRTGIARMILEAEVPVTVVPVVMAETEKIMPIGKKLPRIIRPGVIFGEPLDFSRFQGMKADRFLLRSVTDEIMCQLHALGEQEFRDVYASGVRSRMAKDAAAVGRAA